MKAITRQYFFTRITSFNILSKTLVVLLLLMFASSCSNDAYYEKFEEIEQEVWNMNDIKEFSVNIVDTTSDYRLIFTVRNTTDYAYSNLYVFFTTVNPDQTAVRDTIECLLADRYGRWLGKGSGKIRESRFLLKAQMSFPDTGNYHFILEQAMRDEGLKGITDVGIRIEKTNLK